MAAPQQLSPEQRIAELSEKLDLKEGGHKTLSSNMLGRWVVSKEHSEKVGRYFELNILKPLDTTGQYPAQRFLFLENGTLCGVVRSQVAPNNPDYEEIEEAMLFQVESNLVVPMDEDKQDLITILEETISHHV